MAKHIFTALLGAVALAVITAAVVLLAAFPELRLILGQVLAVGLIVCVVALVCWCAGQIALLVTAAVGDPDWETVEAEIFEWHPHVSRWPRLSEKGLVWGTAERRRLPNTDWGSVRNRAAYGTWEYR